MYKTQSVNGSMVPAKQIRSLPLKSLSFSITPFLLTCRQDISLQTSSLSQASWLLLQSSPLRGGGRGVLDVVVGNTPCLGLRNSRSVVRGWLCRQLLWVLPFLSWSLCHQHWLAPRTEHLWSDQENSSNSNGGKLNSSRALNEPKLLL